jgi:hypothetical protein
MSRLLTARARYALAAVFAIAAIFAGIRVIHVDANMQRVTTNFEADRTPGTTPPE